MPRGFTFFRLYSRYLRQWRGPVEGVHQLSLPYSRVPFLLATIVMAVPAQLPSSEPTPSGEPPVAGPSSSAAVFKRLHPSSYLSRFLTQGYRPDGRKTRSWREVSINVGQSGLLPSSISAILFLGSQD